MVQSEPKGSPDAGKEVKFEEDRWRQHKFSELSTKIPTSNTMHTRTNSNFIKSKKNQQKQAGLEDMQVRKTVMFWDQNFSAKNKTGELCINTIFSEAPPSYHDLVSQRYGVQLEQPENHNKLHP